MRKSIIYLLMLYVTINVANAALSTNITNYYALDGNGNDAVSSNTMNIVGPTTRSSCKIGSCYHWDGNNDYMYANKIDMDIWQAMTVNVWIKLNGTNLDGSKNIFASADDADNANYAQTRLSLDINEYPVFNHRYNGNSQNTLTGTNKTIRNELWHMITFVKELNGNLKIYINGTKTDSNTNTNKGFNEPPAGAVAYLGCVGQNTNTVWNLWKGQIDEVGVWKQALSASEIATLYNSGNGLAYDIAPTTPSGSTLNMVNKSGEELIATGAGGTTNNDILHYGETASYLYRFNCNSSSGTLLQAQSTDNSYVINTTSCPVGHKIYVSVWRKQGTTGTNTSTSAQVLEKQVQSAPAADSCTYSGSGDWNIDCYDNCVINSPVNLGSNALTIIGQGTIIINADITTTGTKTINGTNTSDQCIVQCIGGKCIK